MRNLYVHKTPEITRRNPSESTVVIGCFRYCNPVISGNPSQQPLFEGSLCKPEIPCAVGVAVRCEPTRGALATPRFSPSSLSTVQYRLWWVTIAHRRTFAERGIFRVRSGVFACTRAEPPTNRHTWADKASHIQCFCDISQSVRINDDLRFVSCIKKSKECVPCRSVPDIPYRLRRTDGQTIRLFPYPASMITLPLNRRYIRSRHDRPSRYHQDFVTPHIPLRS